MRQVRVVLVLLAAVLMGACAGITVTTGTYATLDEARQSGAVANGWIPEGLPNGVSEIRIAYLGDGRQWGVFSFSPPDADALRALVAQEATGDVPPCDPPGRLEWWPRILRSPIDLTTVRATGLHVYGAKDRRRTFAVNWNQGRAYYWR